MAYDEHAMQLAAYAYGLGFTNPVLANVFVDYEGNVVIHKWEDTAREDTRITP